MPQQNTHPADYVSIPPRNVSLQDVFWKACYVAPTHHRFDSSVLSLLVAARHAGQSTRHAQPSRPLCCSAILQTVAPVLGSSPPRADHRRARRLVRCGQSTSSQTRYTYVRITGGCPPCPTVTCVTCLALLHARSFVPCVLLPVFHGSMQPCVRADGRDQLTGEGRQALISPDEAEGDWTSIHPGCYVVSNPSFPTLPLLPSPSISPPAVQKCS